MSGKEPIILGETPNGKKIGVRIRPNTTHWELYFDGGGQTPPEFHGVYTTTSQAKQGMLAYLARIEAEGKTKSAKAAS